MRNEKKIKQTKEHQLKHCKYLKIVLKICRSEASSSSRLQVEKTRKEVLDKVGDTVDQQLTCPTCLELFINVSFFYPVS